eukprot:sb/3470716/
MSPRAPPKAPPKTLPSPRAPQPAEKRGLVKSKPIAAKTKPVDTKPKLETKIGPVKKPRVSSVTSSAPKTVSTSSKPPTGAPSKPALSRRSDLKKVTDKPKPELRRSILGSVENKGPKTTSTVEKPKSRVGEIAKPGLVKPVVRQPVSKTPQDEGEDSENVKPVIKQPIARSGIPKPGSGLRSKLPSRLPSRSALSSSRK